MRLLTGEDLLGVWERGVRLHAIDRSLDVLAVALPDRDPQELARLPLGTRDALLLAVRAAMIGDRIEARDACPACGARVEVALTCGALSNACHPPPDEWEIEHDGCRLTLRPLDSLDAAAAAHCDTVDAARAVLLERALVSATRGEHAVAAADLADDAATAVAESIAAHDAGAELMLELSCPSCDHAWRRVLDVASFLDTELAACALRLVDEVHLLARAYGWSEDDILRMSDTRRAAYLALVTA